MVEQPHFKLNTLYIMSFLEVFILSLVEGLTEFLPVSSTGHLILVSHWLGLENTEFLKAFNVIIQFGAILAVLLVYRDKFKLNLTFYKKILIGSLPVMALGFLLKNKIDQLLESDAVVAWSLIIGGVIFIIADLTLKPSEEKTEVSLTDSLKIGVIQCLALIPGVSRSGATIVGAQILKYKKQTAAEFSFFLAVPTLTAATLYKTWKIKHILTAAQASHLSIGIALSFIFAVLAIKGFIKIVSKFGFKWFGVYRIILGSIVLYTLYWA